MTSQTRRAIINLALGLIGVVIFILGVFFYSPWLLLLALTIHVVVIFNSIREIRQRNQKKG